MSRASFCPPAHPHDFARRHRPEAPLRPAPDSISNYTPLFEFYRHKMFSTTDYRPKLSAEAFAPQAELLARWNDREWEGDPLADEVVALFHRLPSGQGRRLFEQALEQGIESVDHPPEALSALFNQLAELPERFDMHKVQRGADNLADLSPLVHYLANTSMVWVSTNVGPVSRMVGATGRFFDIKKSLSRFVETTSYVLGDVSAVDAFQTGSQSLKNGTRVRIMHALVRAHAMNSDDLNVTDYARRGNPMSMRNSISGGITFALYPLWFDALLGGKISAQDYDDACELAGCIAYVNGVEYDVLPRGVMEYSLFFDSALAMHEGVTPFTRELNQAFYLGIPELLKVQSSHGWRRQPLRGLLAGLGPLLVGLNQWMYGVVMVRNMEGMPKLCGWSPYLFEVYARLRPVFDYLDGRWPGQDRRKVRRKLRNRRITAVGFNRLLANLLNRQTSVETRIDYRAHDQTQEADLCGPKRSE